MKKIFLLAMLSSVAFLWTACGGSVVDDALKAAEQEVEIVESPAFGKLPSLQKQYDAAKKSVKDALKVESLSLSEMSKKGEERSKALDELKTIYDEKFITEAKALEGKTIKVTFDDEYFSAGTAVVKLADGNNALYPLIIELRMTLAKPLPKGKGFFGFSGGPTSFSWKYQDAEGNEVGAGTNYIENESPTLALQAGEVYTYILEATNLPNKDRALKFDHIYVEKPEA